MQETTLEQEIKDLRLDMGLSQQDFGQKLGVTLMTVHRWETGKSKPHKTFVAKMRKMAAGVRGAK